ncbi:MAG: type transport system permease protein [Frankiaceae bacterium]|nr:type transport system permease protein [Frankiaceae bacterium]
MNRNGRLALHQLRYEQRAFWRNRTAAFFTFLLPVMFLLIFASLRGNDPVEFGGAQVPFVTIFVPGILAYGITGTTFSNLAINVAGLRETGVLKRVQGTPLPRWVYLAGLIGSACVTTLALSIVVLVIGRAAYGVRPPSATALGLVLMVVLGTAAMSGLGLAISSVIPNREAAPAVTNAIVLPLSFFSGVWFPTETAPRALRLVAECFPLQPLAHGLQHAFLASTSAPGVTAFDAGRLAAWILAGIVAAVRWFRWTQNA